MPTRSLICSHSHPVKRPRSPSTDSSESQKRPRSVTNSSPFLDLTTRKKKFIRDRMVYYTPPPPFKFTQSERSRPPLVALVLFLHTSALAYSQEAQTPISNRASRTKFIGCRPATPQQKMKAESGISSFFGSSQHVKHSHPAGPVRKIGSGASPSEPRRPLSPPATPKIRRSDSDSWENHTPLPLRQLSAASRGVTVPIVKALSPLPSSEPPLSHRLSCSSSPLLSRSGSTSSHSSSQTRRPLPAVAPLLTRDASPITPRRPPSPPATPYSEMGSYLQLHETPSPIAQVASSSSLPSVSSPSNPSSNVLKLSEEFRREREREAAAVTSRVPSGFNCFTLLRMKPTGANPPGLKPRDLPVDAVLCNRFQKPISKMIPIWGLSRLFREHCPVCWTLTGRAWQADHEPFSICATRMHPDVTTGATVGHLQPVFSPRFLPDSACLECWSPEIRCGDTVYSESSHLISGRACVHPRPEAFKHVAWAVYSTPFLLDLCRRDFRDRRIPLNPSVEEWEAWLTTGYNGLTHFGHLLFWLIDVYGCIQNGSRGLAIIFKEHFVPS